MGKTKIFLTDIKEANLKMDYGELYQYILEEIDRGNIKPVKASGLNGKKPALYNAYWKIEEQESYKDMEEKLMFKIHPSLDISYYLGHLEKYVEDGKMIESISDYLTKKSYMLSYAETINERSFEIFAREKFLDREGGTKLLKNLGISLEKLNCYTTSEPMSYYSHHKNTPQNMLIIENKDTFYSMRKHLIERDADILGMSIGTLIYGSGKGIWKSFVDFVQVVEPYFGDKSNKVYYFGDLDYEGIGIYETLVKLYNNIEIVLFQRAYERMLEKAEEIGFNRLPDTKEKQNHNIGNCFMEQFSKDSQEKMRKILTAEKYIPQEILNAQDYVTNQPAS